MFGFGSHIWDTAREYARIRPHDHYRLTFLYARKYLNQRLRRAAQRLAAKFAISRIASELPVPTTTNPTIALHVIGGIGDYVVIARFVRDLLSNSEPLRFSVFCQDTAAANWIFRNFPGYDSAYPEFLFGERAIMAKFALVLNIDHEITIVENWTQSQLLKYHKKLRHIIAGVEISRASFGLISSTKLPDHLIAKRAEAIGSTREKFLHTMAFLEYRGKELDLPTDETILLRTGLAGKNYITVNNGFDGNLVVSGGHTTKYYPRGQELVDQIKAKYPNILIVQIGSKNSIPISSIDVQLVGRTGLGEVAAVLKHSKLHIDNEGGLVHVAQSLSVTCCVLFGPTPVDYFSYIDNINIRPSFCGNCWWATKTWMDVCALGSKEPRCLGDTKVSDILSRIHGRLEEFTSVES